MCGIVGYIGNREATPILLSGLKRLEYRGYDSAGLALLEDLPRAISSNGHGTELVTATRLVIEKCKGKVADLEELSARNPHHSTVGIGHTRWATHGVPSDANAHPHSDQNEKIALIHNGIIENYSQIKRRLIDRGHTFRTETDTEVLAHLIGEFFEQNHNLTEAVRLSLNEVIGTYGIAVVAADDPNEIVVARKGSPLVIGVGADHEYFVASDAAAIIAHTRQVIYLSDNEMATISRSGIKTRTISNIEITKPIEHIEMELEAIEKGGYDHFMLKEIHEQPRTITDGMRGRLIEEEGNVVLGGLQNHLRELRRAKRLIITACGTSFHAGLIGKYMIEQYARIPVDIEYASEFRYRNPIVGDDDVMFAISQSGETADTLAALREAKRKGALGLGMVNVVGSTIARESDAGVYVHAGPEIGVASTKAFTSQLTAFALITIMLGRMRHLSVVDGRAMIRELLSLPEKVQRTLERTEAQVKEIAEIYKDATNFLYLGRGYNYPVALEGALKLKEISYIHAEGYPAAEMKHGPIALIDENMPVVFVAPHDDVYEKILSNIQEVRARKGVVIAIATEGDEHIKELAEHVIFIPETLSMLTPILSVVPLQLLAYYIAAARGCNVDQPRNLAKSVTVE
ncbi:MAG: glutamine--fructose-6-phosphate transaminase (isomerizing) [Bacteroidota bacterium]|nr:glutamine--fructose-6-phosphate transaminase (isomerizing) [Bacteroidota bacterium]MDP4232796.1 glutamine--fructose-6-phosphate transaminase (isomerizing) [Bacteroidota bacterium]MDP4242523.1 glutamine--fructose-6-phosphate transaminase (isomerizing) [Bacteroidota bacterium]MDP4289202.1 glutamine--fructose-6-phosphate transaminase (isomerizing) [Bacteroidota bacterium]